MKDKIHRNTVFLEEATVISQVPHQGDQFILRLASPDCAGAALPGQFVHLQCDPMLAMRRPLSIMRVDPAAGWIELLFKAVGQGTRLLSRRKTGEQISVLGPIGTPFKPSASKSNALLLGGGVGMPPMIFLAEHLKQLGTYNPFVLLGSEVPFPFQPTLSRIHAPSVPANVTHGMPLLDEMGIPSRLASLQGFTGSHTGYITDLARHWLDSLDGKERNQVEIFACGPHAMLAATSNLAREYSLPCQVSLEEFMACAIGGCAGCVVPVKTNDQTAMKRVCVDGPVFDAYSVF